MDAALMKLQRDGPNKVTPPINLPSWMCCLLPCVKAMRFFVLVNIIHSKNEAV